MNVPKGMGLMARLALGLRGPRCGVLGTEFSGEVEGTGAVVTGYGVGDRVVGFTGVRMGAHAEYVCIAEDGLVVQTPGSLSHEEAAGIAFGGHTALHFLRDKGRVRPGHRVLVNGASGAVGSAAVQLGVHFGAEVTGECSAPNIELVRSLGAAKVVDYAKEDVTPAGAGYDIIMDTVGVLSFRRCRRALGPRGVCLIVDAGLPQFGLMAWTATVGGPRAVVGVAPERAEDLRELMRIVGVGGLRPVVDRVYPLERIGEAHRYVDTRRKRGSVVITMGGPRA